jgi:hypothetical protein
MNTTNQIAPRHITKNDRSKRSNQTLRIANKKLFKMIRKHHFILVTLVSLTITVVVCPLLETK